MLYTLSPDCKLVIGRSRAAIYDLHRKNIHLIPLDLAQLFNEDHIDLTDITGELSDFANTLIQHQYIFRASSINTLNTFSLNKDDCIISNCIIEYSPHLPLIKIAEELNQLGCEKVVIFADDTITSNDIISLSEIFCTENLLCSISIYIAQTTEFESEILKAVNSTPIHAKIIFYNSKKSNVRSIENMDVIYTTQNLCLTSCECNCINYKLVLNPIFFNESTRYNNCLYKKVVILKNGNILNCPLSKHIYGSIFRDRLEEVVRLDVFQSCWAISKDQVEECKDCELRYACLDCRYANGGLFSTKKPYWCTYPLD